jgi:hypothetical protein
VLLCGDVNDFHGNKLKGGKSRWNLIESMINALAQVVEGLSLWQMVDKRTNAFERCESPVSSIEPTEASTPFGDIQCHRIFVAPAN